ncbi:MAG TPA: hypothetical protein VHJ17_19095 [Thermomonospora sp.]|nr:hypothetical protein [Thermomonospora sp.]
MKHMRNIAVAAGGSLVLLGLAATPASAATTLRDADTLAPYGGDVRLTLTSPVTVSTSLGGATCNTGNIDATVPSTGSPLNVSVYNFYNVPGPACTNTAGGTSANTALGLPWNGGTLNGDTMTLTITNVQVTSTSTGWFGTLVCNYRGTGAGNSITLSLANPSGATGQMRATATNVSLTKVATGSGLLCPNTATYSAGFVVNGKDSGGNYTVRLTL